MDEDYYEQKLLEEDSLQDLILELDLFDKLEVEFDSQGTERFDFYTNRMRGDKPLYSIWNEEGARAFIMGFYYGS